MVHDSPESWTTVADKAMDELMEVWMADYSTDLLRDTLHILQYLLELRHELSFRWLERHAVGCKAHSRRDTVFLLVFQHFAEDEVRTLLVDSDLRLDDHVVNEPDESAQTVVISLGKLQNSIFELVLLLEEHHGLVFRSLAHLGILKVLLFFERSGVCNLGDKHCEFFADNVVDFLIVMLFDRLS